MKDQLVKEFLHLNRKRRFLLKRLEKDKANLKEYNKRIKKLERIFKGKNSKPKGENHETKNKVFKN